MVRLNNPRQPSVPSTTSQVDRTRRILSAAAQLGTRLDLEYVQMADVARDAGVSLATLYRYYPSKHHLFAALMNESVRNSQRADLVPSGLAAGSPLSAGERVEEMLLHAVRGFLDRPKLARAMLVSLNAVRMTPGAQPGDDHAFRAIVLATAGLESPDDDDLRRIRLLEQCVYGVLTWSLAGSLTTEAAVVDARVACRLTLEQSWYE